MLLEKYLAKFPKHRPAIEKNFALIRGRGCVGILIGKLIPVVRTLIPIPAGVLKFDFAKYTISSALGVFLWNLVFVGAGICWAMRFCIHRMTGVVYWRVIDHQSTGEHNNMEAISYFDC